MIIEFLPLSPPWERDRGEILGGVYRRDQVSEVLRMRQDEFQKFEIDIFRNEKLDIKKKFKIMEALYQEAIALGVFPLKDSLEGLEVDMRIARVINSVSKDT